MHIINGPVGKTVAPLALVLAPPWPCQVRWESGSTSWVEVVQQISARWGRCVVTQQGQARLVVARPDFCILRRGECEKRP